MPAPVIRAIRGHLELEARIGGYEAAAERRAGIEAFYECLAAFLHAHPRNVAYAGSAIDAYERALSSIPFERGDLILTTRDDYVSDQFTFREGARFDFADKSVDWALRISPHYYNTEAEIETLTDALRTIV